MTNVCVPGPTYLQLGHDLARVSGGGTDLDAVLGAQLLDRVGHT